MVTVPAFMAEVYVHVRSLDVAERGDLCVAWRLDLGGGLAGGGLCW